MAVKLVHAVHARNPQIVGRLKQEARATAADKQLADIRVAEQSAVAVENARAERERKKAAEADTLDAVRAIHTRGAGA